MALSEKEELLGKVHNKLAEIVIENIEVKDGRFIVKNEGVAVACGKVSRVLQENSTKKERKNIEITIKDREKKLC